MTALRDLVPFPLAVSGRHGYWGASPRLEVLTRELRDALKARTPTTLIVLQIWGELLNERMSTPDQLGLTDNEHHARHRVLR